MSGTNHEGEEGTGPKDKSAPVAGAKRVPVDDSTLKAVLDRLPESELMKVAEKLLEGRPQQIAAARQKKRERIRWWFTVLLFLGIFADGGAALYVVEWANSASWETVKDWLILAAAPLVPAATVAATFWFPSKEAE